MLKKNEGIEALMCEGFNNNIYILNHTKLNTCNNNHVLKSYFNHLQAIRFVIFCLSL